MKKFTFFCFLVGFLMISSGCGEGSGKKSPATNEGNAGKNKSLKSLPSDVTIPDPPAPTRVASPKNN